MCAVVNFHNFFFVLSGQSCPQLIATLHTMIVSGFFPMKCYQWVILELCMTSLLSLSVVKKRNCKHLILKVGLNA